MKNNLLLTIFVLVGFLSAGASSVWAEDSVHYSQTTDALRHAVRSHQITKVQWKVLINEVVDVRKQENKFLENDGTSSLTQAQIDQLNSELDSIAASI